MGKLRSGIFLAPFHPVDEDPTLAIRRDIELVANTGEQITQRRCTDERRRSATEEDGVHLIRRGENARRHGDFRRKMGVEGGPIDAVP